MRYTVPQLTDRLRSEADAYEFMEELRWVDGPVCPHCDHVGASYIAPANGVSRKTRTGAETQRRIWRCLSCRKQFSVITGTVFHGTKVPLRTWVLVVFEMCASKNGVSAREIERKYGVCPRTAWFVLHRVREAMKTDALVESMRGTIVADETWIGGKPSNRHASASKDPVRINRVVGNQNTDKTPVLALINTTTGEVRSRVVPNVTGAVLRKVISQQVDMGGSTLHTDAGSWYLGLGKEFVSHESVNHEAGEYVPG
jgi:transposase-like protein